MVQGTVQAPVIPKASVRRCPSPRLPTAGPGRIALKWHLHPQGQAGSMDPVRKVVRVRDPSVDETAAC